ncbi:MAG: phage Gp37/Gp68 family protein [Sphingomonas sp.]|nr:phage Gp37/Gp68 family protein [Sphingomonas sp.]
MAERTGIEWADSTANLWIGCSVISAGCDNCYAKAEWADRRHRVTWGPHGDRSYCKAGWALIRQMQRRAAANGELDPDLGRWRRIFVNSLSDFWDNHRSIIWRRDAFELFEQSPDVDLILVTKRPENIAKMAPAHWLNGEWPRHVWQLVSVEDQGAADHRIPILMTVPALVRGISAEPLLGPVDLSGFTNAEPGNVGTQGDAPCSDDCGAVTSGQAGIRGVVARPIPRLNWVIVGGESGPNARPMHRAWACALRDQCTTAGVPFFFKQWGEWAPNFSLSCGGERFQRLGKKKTGRLLDGREYSEFPT